MKKSQIISEIQKLSDREINQFFKSSYYLRECFSTGTRLIGPYNLILDNNIFLRLEEWQKGKISSNLLAIFAFFEWFKSQNKFQCRIVLVASIFYEYCRKSQFEDLNQYWDQFQELKKVFKSYIGLDIFNHENISSFENAKLAIDKIQHDENVLIKEHKRLSNEPFSLIKLKEQLNNEGIDDSRFKNLFSDYLCRFYLEEVQTKYFSSNVFYSLLIEKIKRKISKMKEFKKNFDLKIYHEHLNPIVKINDRRVKGIGDLELFLIGNLKSQNEMQKNGQNYYPYIPLTLDDDLFKVLKKNAVMINGWSFQKGKDDDVFESIMRQDYEDQKRRVPFAENNMKGFYESYENYFDDYFEIVN